MCENAKAVQKGGFKGSFLKKAVILKTVICFFKTKTLFHIIFLYTTYMLPLGQDTIIAYLSTEYLL